MSYDGDVVDIEARRRTGRLILFGFGVFVLGRAVDFWWHATHPGFETAGDQVRAHVVVWLGVLILLVGAVRAVVDRPSAAAVLLLGAVLLNVGVSVWHFWEHYRLRDPELPHLLLLIANVGIVLGVAWLWVHGRPGGARRSPAGA